MRKRAIEIAIVSVDRDEARQFATLARNSRLILNVEIVGRSGSFFFNGDIREPTTRLEMRMSNSVDVRVRESRSGRKVLKLEEYRREGLRAAEAQTLSISTGRDPAFDGGDIAVVPELQ